jgi:thiamine-phosphate pyrophosphorylase
MRAIAEGADYIGVGPIFKTPTKEKKLPVGFEYLDYAVANVKIPFVAIGGIKEHNIRDIIAHGARRVALVSEITGAEDITSMVKRLNSYF